MKQKRRFAFNRLFNAFILFALLLAFMGVALLEESLGGAIGCWVFALVGFSAAFVTQPCCYLFDREGVTMCYTFFPNERYLWYNISAIEVKEDSGSCSSKTLIFDWFFSYAFHLYGNAEGKHRFYMQGEIRKTLRTKRLLEKYWDGRITGYFRGDVKEWKEKRRARKAKKDRENAKHLTDEIVPMEREARANVRAALQPLVDQAAHAGLALRTEYLYVTRDGEERKSRPDEGYTYTVLVEISYPNETDENRIVTVSTELLFVRLGKTAYRGVVNGNAAQELCDSLSDVLTEIQKHGIEVYCGGEK